MLKNLKYKDDLDYCLNVGGYKIIDRVEKDKIVRVDI